MEEEKSQGELKEDSVKETDINKLELPKRKRAGKSKFQFGRDWCKKSK